MKNKDNKTLESACDSVGGFPVSIENREEHMFVHHNILELGWTQTPVGPLSKDIAKQLRSQCSIDEL